MVVFVEKEIRLEYPFCSSYGYTHSLSLSLSLPATYLPTLTQIVYPLHTLTLCLTHTAYAVSIEYSCHTNALSQTLSKALFTRRQFLHKVIFPFGDIFKLHQFLNVHILIFCKNVTDFCLFKYA